MKQNVNGGVIAGVIVGVVLVLGLFAYRFLRSDNGSIAPNAVSPNHNADMSQRYNQQRTTAPQGGR